MPPHIISASRRTDIPAFHAAWLMERIREGFCEYPNPLFPSKLHRVSLRSEDVLGWVFWTRDAAPLLPRLRELDRHGAPYMFQYTVVGYPRIIEPRSPSVEQAVATICELAERIGSERVVWRYDPVLICRACDQRWHRENFQRLADRLATHVRHLVVSVVDDYAHSRRELAPLSALYDLSAYAETLAGIAAAATERGLAVFSCAEPELRVPGLCSGRCVDLAPFREFRGEKVPETPVLHRQRKGCLCHRSVDIGTGGTCGFGCRYCYAAGERRMVNAPVPISAVSDSGEAPSPREHPKS